MVSTEPEVIRWGKEVFEVVDFEELTRQQEKRCTGAKVIQMKLEARNHDLPNLDEIDEQCFIIQDMLTLQLGNDDTFITDNKTGKKQRLIYGSPQELEDEEEAHAQAFIQFTNQLNYSVPEEYWTNDRLMMRLLAAEKYNNTKALQRMIDHSKWIRETYPIRYNDIAPILKSGFLYVSGRDKMYRPLMILNVRKLIDGNYPIEAVQAASAFFCDFVVKKLLVPGRVENWVMIIDLNDVGMTSLPAKKVQAIVGLTQKHFGGRLFRQFIINMSFMMRKASSLFLNFVDEITQKKIFFHNDKTYKPDLAQLIQVECLEKKYGGRKPDIRQEFFPPDMRMPGKQLLTVAQLKAQCPDAMRYIALWGAKKALAEEQRKEQEAIDARNRRDGEMLTPLDQVNSVSGVTGSQTTNHFLDELINEGKQSREDIVKHSVYLKPSRISSMVMTRPVFDDQETQMNRMSVGSAMTTETDTEFMKGSRDSVVSDATQMIRSNNRDSGATEMIRTNNRDSVATSFMRVDEEEEEENDFIRQSDEARMSVVQAAAIEIDTQAIIEELLCEEFGTCQQINWYDQFPEEDDDPETLKALEGIKEYL